MEGKNMSNYFDVVDLSLIILVFGLMISFVIFVTNLSIDQAEEHCVKFYKENHYVINKCEKYREKLENMEV